MLQQVLGLNLIAILMQEYATTVKSADVGLPWEAHFKAKKQFEVTDLRRIFQFCLRIVSEIIKSDPPYNDSANTVLKHLLAIIETILTWGYISPMHILSEQFMSYVQLCKCSVCSLIMLTAKTCDWII